MSGGDADELRIRLAELERQNAELRATESRYRVLAESSTAGIWHIRPTGETLFANPAMCRMLEVADREALAERSAFEFFTDESLEIIRREHARRAEGMASSYEVELVGDRGAHRRVVIAGAPIQADGVLESLIGTFTDVTEERRATVELHRTSARLELALDATGTGLFEWDVVNDRLDVWYAGRAVRQNTSLEASLLQAIQPEHHDQLRRRFKEVLGDAQRADFDLEYQIPIQGTVRWRSSKCRVLRDAEGRPLSVVGASVDITDKKELEIRVASAERLDSLGRLAGGIAHDFNNLLTVIVGWATTLRSDTPDIARGLEDIREAADRATRLTQQLLAFARRQPLAPVPVDLGALLQSAGDWLGRVLGGDIDLVLDVAADLPAVLADPSQLEQIIMNLATNARDAMPAGGQLHIDVRQSGSTIAMLVTDTGVGMDERTRERAFEPFFTTKETGTGLGLATTYGVITQLGGQLSMRSAPERGTTVEVLLPAIDPIAESPPAPPPPALRSAGERLLVVDDQTSVLRVVCESLRQLGYHVLAASSGIEALALIDSDVALLVTDVRMPGMSGPELARRAREMHPAIRVLFISGYSDEEVATAPWTAFLPKPFRPQELSRAIRQLLDTSAS